jgi:pseudouridine synthase
VVSVNGRVAPLGAKVAPGHDQVTLHGRPIEPPRGQRYLAISKPAGVLVTARDPGGRPTVFDLLPAEERERHLFAVGRLDWDSEGLLLLTDDGELAYRLTHPRYKIDKEYLVEVTGHPADGVLRRLRRGVELDDGRTQPAQVELKAAAHGRSRLQIVITEGKRRQIRRMLQTVGHPVTRLIRIRFGAVRLGRLRPGSYRRLSVAELSALRQVAGLASR